MDEKIDNIIPTLAIVLEFKLGPCGENASQELLDYYLRCDAREKAVVNNVLMYLCGETFEGVLFECGLQFGKQGELITVQKEQ